MAHPPPGTPDDGARDDLASLDFSVSGEDAGETDLGVILGDYTSEVAADEPEPLGALESFADNESGDEPPMPMFTVTNPPETVTVTTYMDGRVHQIDLSTKAATLAEAVLAEEIVVIAGLATQDARSAQYTFMLDGMREHGHDNAATRDFLNRDLDLPTPQQAQAARAELFTTRYAGEE